MQGEKTLLPFASSATTIAYATEQIAWSVSAVIVSQRFAICTDDDLAAGSIGPLTAADIRASATFNGEVHLQVGAATLCLNLSGTVEDAGQSQQENHSSFHRRN